MKMVIRIIWSVIGMLLIAAANLVAPMDHKAIEAITQAFFPDDTSTEDES